MFARRLTRRSLITDFGAAGVGVIILGACAGSSDSSPPETADDPPDDDSPDVDPPDDDPTEDEAAAGQESESSPENQLQLQHVSLGFVSAYVLVRGNEAAVVDTGQAGSRDAILAGLDIMSVTPEMVGHVVLTHNHGDHIGGLAELEEDLTRATVYAGTGDIGSIQTSLTLTEVGDGDEVLGMGIIATPGHTPGSISLFDTDTGILVAGDAINGDGEGGLTGANPDFSPDMDSANASVAKMAALMPTVAAFGHGGEPVTEDVAAKLNALI